MMMRVAQISTGCDGNIKVFDYWKMLPFRMISVASMAVGHSLYALFLFFHLSLLFTTFPVDLCDSIPPFSILDEHWMVLLALTGKVICGMYLWWNRIVGRHYLQVSKCCWMENGANSIAWIWNTMNIDDYDTIKMEAFFGLTRCWLLFGPCIHVQSNRIDGRFNAAGTL